MEDRIPRRPLAFPPTYWDQIRIASGECDGDRKAALNAVIERYWMPVHAFVQYFAGTADADDLTQEFFLRMVERGEAGILGKADEARGRFRNYLLGALKNFLCSKHQAGKRWKNAIPLELAENEFRPGITPADERTPEAAFHRAWLRELLKRTTLALEREFGAEQRIHYELFREYIATPFLEDGSQPEIRELAKRWQLGRKEVANRMVTARRAFQRLLRAEILTYAQSEDEVALEVHDLFEFASGSRSA